MKKDNFVLRKNQKITLSITGMTAEGSGVGKYDGMAVFVPMTAIGDTIECTIVKTGKSFCFGKCAASVYRALCGLRNGGIFPRTG